jgi:hypothetical protein
MFNATTTRALVGALVLVCAPAMAISPPAIQIRLGGAEQVGPSEYVVHRGDVIDLKVQAGMGDLIWAFAAPLNSAGEADYDSFVTLLLDKAPTGQLSGEFKIPKGLEGLRFQVEAASLSDAGKVSWSTQLIVDVNKPDDTSMAAAALDGAAVDE